MSAVPRELVHFLTLSADQQAQAIRRMAAAGHSDYGIAAATRLSVEFVRRVLAEGKQNSHAVEISSPPKCVRTGIPASVCTCIGPHEGRT